MKKRFLLILILISLFFVSLTQQSAAKTPEQIASEMDKYTVRIFSFKFEISTNTAQIINIKLDTIGSGSMIECKKYGFCVITARHICIDEDINTAYNSFSASFSDTSLKSEPLELIGYSNDFDVCILKFNNQNFKPQKTVEIGKSSEIKKGLPIFIMGSSSHFREFAFHAGILSSSISLGAKSPFLGWPIIISIDVLTLPGYSGGPIVSENNKLVGIIVGKSIENNNLSTGLPIDEIMKEIEKILNNSKIP